MTKDKENKILYNEYSQFLKRFFPYKVQKISLNAGFTCPNRDGMKGRGGCTYCNNQTFNPEYCSTEKSITQQLQEGKEFFAHKYPDMKYLAYFQAYTNTYSEIDVLKKKYEEALSVMDIVGLIIGTRPDCMPNELLDYLSELNKSVFVAVEYGAESVNNSTLTRINRGHTYEETIDAVNRTKEKGLITGVHTIVGLPKESKEDIINQAKELSKLPIDTIKLHQLQLIKGTKMALEYKRNPEDFHLYNDVEEYIDVVIDYLEHLRPDITVERFTSQSPKELLIAPDWGIKNYEFVAKLRKRMAERGSYQGKNY
ncbi:MAG: TIGR01212 family radical SAM protein [Bacteroides sp.]|nr:TIGR01212 family radical SAM protein [Bacteroides sp.]